MLLWETGSHNLPWDVFLLESRMTNDRGVWSNGGPRYTATYQAGERKGLGLRCLPSAEPSRGPAPSFLLGKWTSTAGRVTDEWSRISAGGGKAA